MFNKGIIFDERDVIDLYQRAGYPMNLPNTAERIHASGVPIGNISLAASQSFDRFGNYFLRENDSSFNATDPATAGEQMPYFFGRSVLYVQVTTITLPARLIISEVTFGRCEDIAGTAVEQGRISIARVDLQNLVEGDIIQLESVGDNTRYWSLNGVTGVGGQLTLSLNSFWSGFGGIERVMP